MKKLLIAVSLAVTALMSWGCGSSVQTVATVSVMVSARVEFNSSSGEIVPTETHVFGPYSHYTLSEYELGRIFASLTNRTLVNYTTAFLILDYTGAPQTHEEYGVLVIDGEFYMLPIMAQ